MGHSASPTPTAGVAKTVSLMPYLTGYEAPVFLTNAGDGSHRLFIVEQAGKIRIVDAAGTQLSQPFLDISALVLNSGERGLLSMAFHPHYRQNGWFFVDYTDHQGTIMIVRYSVSADANRADPASAKVIMRIPHPVANHNGGQLLFGKDGLLYIGVGDGGEGNSANGQRTSLLLGKILRIDVDHQSGSLAYAIPATNPYVAANGTRPEIWAYGLRNPWRFSFDAETSDLYIGDVGGGSQEEIDVQPHSSHGGENYGWNVWEGVLCSQNGSPCMLPHLTLPNLVYSHDNGNCAVIGGYVYRGQQYPTLRGRYFYGDYCSGDVSSVMTPLPAREANPDIKLATTYRVVAFGADEDGELYLVDGLGSIVKITAAGS
ncbi:MAG: PQQ-dependent sugar dehydrogenase [Ktedonobacterales bacterium]|nr:PQQ-dependent sugar dehydrogenase [Ktedonobacterales bacterium]